MNTVVSFLRRWTLLRHLLVAVAAAALLYGLTQWLSDYRNIQLADIAMELCAVAGLTILTGHSGQISLGNGAFMFVGAYTVALIFEHHTVGNAGLVWVLASAVVVSAIIGGLIGVAAARLRGPYLAGVTLALAIGLPVLPKYQKLSALGGHAGIPVGTPPAPGGMDLFRWQALLCCLAAVITVFVLANLARSRTGRAFRAVRDDEIAASLAGLPVARIQILAFTVSAASAGLAGGLFAVINGSVGPDSFGLSLSLGLLAAIVLGGLGSLIGAIYGSIIITLLPQWSTDLASALSLPDKVGNNLPIAVYGVVLIAVILAFPFGLQGVVQRVGQITRRTRNSPVTIHRT
ncbi:MAG TPA: branched-chain amino acid ABC transporter permease [Mycobacteriales bacterium]|nr:branched-chain amino acid ABC transporter permease [Mycobacteriales bacterium]